MNLRSKNIEKLPKGVYDVLVLGGGINGAVSAAALAARGARVALIDRGDFAGFTSQESSNLAWGGLKYLESYELGLVRKLCLSRNELLRSFPSTVREIRFYAVHPRGFRHGLFKLLVGVWLYWFIGGCFTRRPRRLTTEQMSTEEPLLDLAASDGGFEYSDAYLHDNDARFVWNLVRSALDRGCTAANYIESLGSTRGDDGLWTTRARDRIDGGEVTIRARVLVNACGPFVDEHNALTGQATRNHHVFSKGIHLVVDRIVPRRRILTFFADDGRPFFIIPMGRRTVIGTTDTRVDEAVSHVTAEDRRFLLDNVNKRANLDPPLAEGDIVAERCGVRPLAVEGGTDGDDWMQLSRKHVVEVNRAEAHVSIFGGKITDCVNVGDEICDRVRALGVRLPYARTRWYGEPNREVKDAFVREARRLDLDARTPPGAPEPLSARFWRRYGGRAFELLDRIRTEPGATDVVIEGADYVRCEIEHAARREMIAKLEDFLRRRSKIALVMRRAEIERATGLLDACRILFGSGAETRRQEYFESERTRNDHPAR